VVVVTLRLALALLSLAAAALVAGCASGEDKSGGTEVTVERIVDGDTLVLADGQRVRLVQIDASEAQEGECYGEEATTALEGFVPAGARVRLEADPALDRVDRFDRLLRYVIRDGKNLNLELVARGAAAPYFFRGDRGRHADELVEAAEAARDEELGLWSACPGTRLDPTRALDTDP
jgi:endonuclease YncB( thermonuclease family)